MENYSPEINKFIVMKHRYIITSLFLVFGVLGFGQYSQEASNLFTKGNESINAGRFNEALGFYSQAISLEPEFKEAFKNRGITYTMIRDNESALKDFDAALDLSSTDADLYNFRGFAHAEIAHETGDSSHFVQAIKDIKKSIALDSGYAESYLNLGIVYMWLGDNELALEKMNHAIARNPANGKAFYDRGIVHKKLGNLPLACLDWERAKALYFPLAADVIAKHCE